MYLVIADFDPNLVPDPSQTKEVLSQVNNFAEIRVLFMLKDSKGNLDFYYGELINFYKDVGGCFGLQISARASALIALSRRHYTTCLLEDSKPDSELRDRGRQLGKHEACNNKQ